MKLTNVEDCIKKKYIEEGEKFEIPDISIRKSGNNYNYLDNNGIIKNNT